MKSKVLFWHEEHTLGRQYALMDQCISLFGLECAVIDTTGRLVSRPGQFPYVFHSFSEARSAFSDHSWVCFDLAAQVVLDEYEHPTTPTVYAFGSDNTRFDIPVEELPGTLVKLRQDVGYIWVYQMLPLVLYDRYLYHQGRRK